MAAVDDERQLVFECPAFECFRAARKHVFNRNVEENMQAFMNQRDSKGVMRCVLDCFRCIARQAANNHN